MAMVIKDHGDRPVKPSLRTMPAVTSPRTSTARASSVALKTIGPNIRSMAASLHTPRSWSSSACPRALRRQLRTIESGRSSCLAIVRCPCPFAARWRAVPTTSAASRQPGRKEQGTPGARGFVRSSYKQAQRGRREAARQALDRSAGGPDAS